MPDAAPYEAITDALEKATPGPWELVVDSCDCGGGYPCSHGEFPYAIHTSRHRQWGFDGELPCSPESPTDYIHHQCSELSEFTMEDAHLIANAPSWLAALVEENKQLRAAIDELIESVEHVPLPNERYCRTCGGDWPCANTRACALLSDVGQPT